MTAHSLPNSQALKPEWTAIQSQDSERIASVDCSAHPKLCEEFQISVFPTIRLYRQNGKPYRYRGPRKAASINGFLQRMLRPAVSHVSSKNTTSFLVGDEVVFVAQSAPGDTSLGGRFTTVAEKYRDRYSFAVSSDASQLSTVICYNNPDDLQRSTTELASPASLEAFIKLCAMPLIPELTRRNEITYYASGKSLVHYFIHTSSQRETYVTEMLPLAKKYHEYLHFTTTDANEYPDAVEMMGLRRGATGLSVQNPSNGDVFPYTGRQKITAGVVETFLVDIIQGRVKPWGQDNVEHEEL
ncbi:hypothetical protein B0T25DRAFT_609157 [Lasiosphaeria hispida]|uniref:Thioredoxin domain-containing protein n=1 Tax=Lasiosphaeria hispida TaxID=260671 RepID=A0AAJ0HDJ9_9PEZI|nr:hypothetical protein B0T25DRAFT_609157 [Lasiosphaeria hispida]